jgi:hypothetical protein
MVSVAKVIRNTHRIGRLCQLSNLYQMLLKQTLDVIWIAGGIPPNFHHASNFEYAIVYKIVILVI